jgi:hypothetical protein
MVRVKVMATAVSISLDWNPQMEIVTNRAIRMVKMMNMGRACLLKKSVQQAMTIVTPIKHTDTTVIIAVLTNIRWNVALLYPR